MIYIYIYTLVAAVNKCSIATNSTKSLAVSEPSKAVNPLHNTFLIIPSIILLYRQGAQLWSTTLEHNFGAQFTGARLGIVATIVPYLCGCFDPACFITQE